MRINSVCVLQHIFSAPLLGSPCVSCLTFSHLSSVRDNRISPHLCHPCMFTRGFCSSLRRGHDSSSTKNTRRNCKWTRLTAKVVCATSTRVSHHPPSTSLVAPEAWNKMFPTVGEFSSPGAPTPSSLSSHSGRNIRSGVPTALWFLNPHSCNPEPALCLCIFNKILSVAQILIPKFLQSLQDGDWARRYPNAGRENRHCVRSAEICQRWGCSSSLWQTTTATSQCLSQYHQPLKNELWL